MKVYSNQHFRGCSILITMKSCIESNFISVAIILLYSTKKHMKYIVLLDLDFSFFLFHCYFLLFFSSNRHWWENCGLSHLLNPIENLLLRIFYRFFTPLSLSLTTSSFRSFYFSFSLLCLLSLPRPFYFFCCPLLSFPDSHLLSLSLIQDIV